MPPLDDELTLACRLAREAGDAILAVRARAMRTSRTKADASPVTEADLAADSVIRAGLAPLGDPVITEETWQDAGPIGAHSRAWFIDPIDGTEDFVAGRDDYVVQIGLCIEGRPALGVVYQPSSGVLWRGVVERGLCERVAPDGSVTSASVRTRTLGTPRIAVSVSHPSAAVDAVVRGLGGIPVPRGSVGLKVGLILEDKADAYITMSRRLKVWDTCAPAALLLAAGGVVSSSAGQTLEFTGTAAHGDGACMWTAAARDALRSRVDEVLRQLRARGSP